MLPMLRNATSTYLVTDRVFETGVSRNNGQAREKTSRADWSLHNRLIRHPSSGKWPG